MKFVESFNENTSNTRETTEQEREVFEYLNDLRDSGITNMFGASSYIQEEFSVTSREATKLLSTWMSNFNEEGNYDTVKL